MAEKLPGAVCGRFKECLITGAPCSEEDWRTGPDRAGQTVAWGLYLFEGNRCQHLSAGDEQLT